MLEILKKKKQKLDKKENIVEENERLQKLADSYEKKYNEVVKELNKLEKANSTLREIVEDYKNKINILTTEKNVILQQEKKNQKKWLNGFYGEE